MIPVISIRQTMQENQAPMYQHYILSKKISNHSSRFILHLNRRKILTTVWFGLVYLFIHSVTYVTLDTSITDYNLYITTQLIIFVNPHNTI